MAKGSKKYAGHEYSFTSPAKSGLGSELNKQKERAHSHRKGARPPGFSDGGTIQAGISQAAAQGGVPHTAVNTMSSVAGGLAGAFGKKAKGGEVKKKENNAVKDIGDDNKAGSIYEMSSSYKKGGEVKAENKSEKATVKGDSPKNDKVPILASEGEFVVKRSIMNSKDAPKKAAKVIKEAKEKDKKKK